MHPVKPPIIKSECSKKEVKRPPAPRPVDRRPPWDNSLHIPKERQKLKPLPNPDKKPDANEEPEDPDNNYGMPDQPRDCKDRGCYTRNEKRFSLTDRPPSQQAKVICGQYPCAHPRFPQCAPPHCFPVQCYRTGPTKDMKCCMCQPYAPPTRKVFCHKIYVDDTQQARPDHDYQFSYLD